MKKFVLIYHSSVDAMQKMMTSEPDIMQAEQKKWMDWFGSLGDHLVEMGEMFSQKTKLTTDGFSDIDGDISGYSIIQAEDFEAAKKLVENHPHPGWAPGCTVELYEPMDMNQ